MTNIPPAVSVTDVCRKFTWFDRNTGLDFLKTTTQLNAYQLGKSWYCERKFFDEYLISLINPSKSDIIKDTLLPAITINDIINHFDNISKGTALKFMRGMRALHTYQIRKSFYCEQQYFKFVLSELSRVGGSATMSLALSDLKKYVEVDDNPVLENMLEFMTFDEALIIVENAKSSKDKI